MITEDYVSFETAKLLKEKGFDLYNTKELYVAYKDGYCVINNPHTKHYPTDEFPKATLQMAMKWLRELHKIDVWVECHNSNRRYKGYIHSEQRGDEALFYEDSYEEACETAIKYCLENLIGNEN